MQGTIRPVCWSCSVKSKLWETSVRRQFKMNKILQYQCILQNLRETTVQPVELFSAYGGMNKTSGGQVIYLFITNLVHTFPALALISALPNDIDFNNNLLQIQQRSHGSMRVTRFYLVPMCIVQPTNSCQLDLEYDWN